MKFLNFWLLSVLFIFFADVITSEETNAENEMVPEEEAVEQPETEEDIVKRLPDIGYAIEKNLMWIARLKTKNFSQMSFVDGISLKYDIRDMIEFMRKLRNQIRLTNYSVEFHDNDLIRQLNLLTNHIDVLPLDETFTLTELIENWNDDLDDKQYCSYQDETVCELSINEITEQGLASTDPAEIKSYWTQWMDTRGKQKREKYVSFLYLYGKAAKLNDFTKGFLMMYEKYDISGIEKMLRIEMRKIFPFYQQLHGNLRRLLRKDPNNRHLIPKYKSPIPDYLLTKVVLESELDTTLMTFKDITPHDLLDKVKEFYESLGLEIKINYKVLVEDGHNVPRFDSSLGKRELKFILSPMVNERNFVKMFSEVLSMIEYNNEQPYAYKNIAPNGLRLAIGNAMAFSALSTSYSVKNGFSNPDDHNSTKMPYLIKKLYLLATKTLLPMQRSIAITKTLECMQVEVINKDKDCAYWENKLKYQGVTGEERDSDYDVLAEKDNQLDEVEIEQMFSMIVGCEIYENLCTQSEQYSDNDSETHLADCDFSGNMEIGERIKDILSTGGSINWMKHLSNLFAPEKFHLTSTSFLKYFKPLKNWLEVTNDVKDVTIGW